MRLMSEGPGLAYQRVYGGTDPDSLEGAQRVAQTIRDYWSKRGHTVHVTIERDKHSRGDGTKALWLIRSNLIGGQPRSLPLTHPAVKVCHAARV